MGADRQQRASNQGQEDQDSSFIGGTRGAFVRLEGSDDLDAKGVSPDRNNRERVLPHDCWTGERRANVGLDRV